MSKYAHKWGDITLAQAISKYERNEIRSNVTNSRQRLKIARGNSQQSQQQHSIESENVSDCHLNGSSRIVVQAKHCGIIARVCRT